MEIKVIFLVVPFWPQDGVSYTCAKTIKIYNMGVLLLLLLLIGVEILEGKVNIDGTCHFISHNTGPV